MPFTFSLAEYADMVYVYGFCAGNAVPVTVEHHRRFMNHRIPTGTVPTPLLDTGTYSAVRVTATRDVNKSVHEEESIVQMVRASTQRIARRLMFPKLKIWITLHAKSMHP